MVLCPRGRDAEVIRTTLWRERYLCDIVLNIDELVEGLTLGAGAVVMSEEALYEFDCRQLIAWRAGQEPWSDFPFIVLMSKLTGIPAGAARSPDELGNVILLERPLNAQTLNSATAAALRGRRRQYEARAALAERMRTAETLRRSQAELVALNDTLETRIDERTRALAQANDRLMNEIIERERVQGAMFQLQKMEAVGRLTGGIAHDFNNLLNVIQSGMDLILLTSKEDGTKRRADMARLACGRGAKLTGQLLAFSRNQKLNLRATNLTSLFDGLHELVSASVGSKIMLRLEIDEPNLFVLADLNQLEMALLNLAINARDAMPTGGSLTFRAAATIPPKDLLAPGEYVLITVSDTGPGMQADILARVFEPFFTTKKVGEGTGLGLSQVYGMAQQSGGLALINSVVGQGTTVEIWLRIGELLEEEVSVSENRRSSTTFAGVRVLVVEDDDFVRQNMVDSLISLGCTVAEAANGEAGLIALQHNRPDLLITDYLMPGISGAELMRRTQEAFPGLPAIMATGYADMKAVEEVLGNNELLKKPFALAELAASVERSLQRSRA